MSNIIWIDIEGYENHYQISNFGDIKSCNRKILKNNGRTHSTKERILKSRFNKAGYKIISLVKFGKMKTYLVHRLVAQMFIGKCPVNKQVAHNDGNKLNNFCDNLRYATIQENTKDRIEHGTIVKGEKVKNSKLTEDIVKKIRNEIGTQFEIANKYGINQTNVGFILRRVTWKHI